MIEVIGMPCGECYRCMVERDICHKGLKVYMLKVKPVSVCSH